MSPAFLRYFTVSAGRLSPSETEQLGRELSAGVGYIGIGPFLLLFDLPARWRKADPEPEFYEPSIDEINAAIRAQRAAQEEAARNLHQS